MYSDAETLCLYFTDFFLQNAQKLQTMLLCHPVLIGLVYYLSVRMTVFANNSLDKRFFRYKFESHTQFI